MAFTTSLRNKHKEIVFKIIEINHLISNATEDNTGEIFSKLNQFGSILRSHLATEDNTLYPILMDCENEELAYMAREFQLEMGGLKDNFIQFTKKYNSPYAIDESFSDFISELAGIMSVLSKRIQREEKELYSLADRVIG